MQYSYLQLPVNVTTLPFQIRLQILQLKLVRPTHVILTLWLFFISYKVTKTAAGSDDEGLQCTGELTAT